MAKKNYKSRKKYSLSERIAYYRKKDKNFADKFRSNKNGAMTQSEFEKFLVAYKKNRRVQYASGYVDGATGQHFDKDATAAERKGYAAGEKALNRSKAIKF